MLADHVAVGVAHLFSDPVDRRNPSGQQLTGVGVPALPGASIANAGREQVRLEETIAHHEIISVRQAAFGVQEHKVQFVFSHRLVVPLDHLHVGRRAAERVPGGRD